MDNSEMAVLLSCPRKHQYLYGERITEEDKALALSFGTAWHKIMEAHNKGESDPIQAIGDYIDPPDDYRTYDKLRKAYASWRQQYQNVPWNVIHSEWGIRSMIGTDPYEGLIDVVVETDSNHIGHGLEKWIVDYKTASRMELDWVTTYRVSNQFKLYLRNARKAYPDLVGVCVDVYHATKGAVKTGKTQEDIDGNKFYRQFFRYEEFELDEAEKDFMAANLIKRTCEDAGYWPKNTGACRMYNRTCEFIDLCDASTPELREMLKENFVPNTFDPLRRDV